MAIMTLAPEKKLRAEEYPSDSTVANENSLRAITSVATGMVSPPVVDPELEKQALRRFDMFLLPQLAILTILAYLDRTNIGKPMTVTPEGSRLTMHRKCQSLWLC